jgi:hypothetical protein
MGVRRRLPGLVAVLAVRGMNIQDLYRSSGYKVGYNVMGKHPSGAALVREGHWQGSLGRGIVGGRQGRRWRRTQRRLTEFLIKQPDKR